MRIGPAIDYVRTAKSDDKVKNQNPVASVEALDLDSYLRLCIGCKVILIRNIDVNDGLVNGSFGKVVQFEQIQPNSPFSCVFVVLIRSQAEQKQP